MLYVVDASILIKWLIPEEHSDKAEQFVAAFRDGRVDFVAPDSSRPRWATLSDVWSSEST